LANVILLLISADVFLSVVINVPKNKTIDPLEGHMFHLKNILNVFLLGATNHVLSFSLIYSNPILLAALSSAIVAY